jgi:thiamine-phosphate pyrophosphorylase
VTIDHRLSTVALPRLYPILDASCFADDRALFQFAEDLLSAGVILLQYRNKQGSARQMLSQARELRRIAGTRARLIMNDRADLCLAAGFDGVHVGQDDLPPQAVRGIIGPRPWLGVSTHNSEQLRQLDPGGVDYVAIGPVFTTTSKLKPDPVEGVRAARAITRKPLVAIGGITRANARSVLEAGADSVAVISDLVHNPRSAIQEFNSILR